MGRTCVVAVALVLGLAGVASAAVEVQPFRIEESRSAALMADTVGHSPDRLTLILALKGPEADASVRYGNLKLQEAVDDQGNNLILPKSSFDDPATFRDYSNAFFRESHLKQKRPPDVPQMKLSLALSKRSAARIAHLRGTFDLAQQGTIKTVELTKLLSPGEKKLAIPPEAGITITVTTKSGNDVRSIELAITGDENALESIEVVDADGNKVSYGMSSWSFNGGPAQKSLDLKKPLDDSMKLVTKIAVDRKMVTVPFDLKDIALP
jgi:hypothetical protein